MIGEKYGHMSTASTRTQYSSHRLKEPDNFGFPRRFLGLLRCIHDSSALVLCEKQTSDEQSILNGALRCTKCSREYLILDGIARMMPEELTPEAQNEIALKDCEYEAMPEVFIPPSSGWRSELNDRIEIPPHMTALNPLKGKRVLELACGDGRFTTLMVLEGAEVLAVDFSSSALSKLKSRLRLGTAPTTYGTAKQTKGLMADRVGLVQADISRFHIAPQSFDRALSATPLDDRDERMKMYGMVAESLKDNGHYVAGVEHDDLLRRLFGLPVVRRYSPNGILIEHLDMPTLRREMAPFFHRLHMRPIRATIPFVKTVLPVQLASPLLRIACVMPVLRHFGEILLVRAESPIRLPNEGVRRPGWGWVKHLFRRYKRWIGEEPVWDPGWPV